MEKDRIWRGPLIILVRPRVWRDEIKWNRRKIDDVSGNSGVVQEHQEREFDGTGCC